MCDEDGIFLTETIMQLKVRTCKCSANDKSGYALSIGQMELVIAAIHNT